MTCKLFAHLLISASKHELKDFIFKMLILKKTIINFKYEVHLPLLSHTIVNIYLVF